MSLGDTSLSDPLTVDGGGQSLAREDVFEVLSNERRRCVLHYLKKHGDRRVELRELVDHVAAWENDTTTRQVDSDERKRVYTALRQSHLPKLEQAGVVEYEHLRGEVELKDQAKQVQVYLEHVPSGDIPWNAYYLGLSGVSAALVVAAWVGAFPFVHLSGLDLAAILVVLFAISAAVHTYDASRKKLGAEEYEVPEE